VAYRVVMAIPNQKQVEGGMLMELVVLACILSGALGGFIREVYGLKGVFVLPRKTGKTYALGSFLAVICGAFAAVLNLAALWGAIAQLSWPQNLFIAISLGAGWGIAFNDVLANAITAAKGE